MRLVVFGLSASASGDDGRAARWRSLMRALTLQGHRVRFFERAAPPAAHDCAGFDLGAASLERYGDFEAVREHAARALREADAGLVTSDCPDAAAAIELLLGSKVAVKSFYDLDTPRSLTCVARGEWPSYLGPRGLADFDVVCSQAGGPLLDELRCTFAARRVVALHCGVDPELYAPVEPSDRYRADVSFFADYDRDREAMLNELFMRTAQQLPNAKFLLAGSRYPSELIRSSNVRCLWHVGRAEHAVFRCSARLNLNVTCATTAAFGYYAPPGLFEAAACGAPLITNAWRGLEQFYAPDEEVIVVHDRSDVIAALERSDGELKNMAVRARERTLAEHTIERRAQQLIEILSTAKLPQHQTKAKKRWPSDTLAPAA